jgi:recombination protein RecA
MPPKAAPKATDKTDASAALTAALAQIKKQFGDGAIMRLEEDGQVKKIPVIPTGALSLDIALGVGGLPRGRIVEIYGPESSGKTTLMLHVVANAQRAGGTCAFIDTEHALDPVYAKRIGVDVANLLVSQPDSGEEALAIAERLIKTNALDVIVVDSVAALTPKAEIEGEIGDSFVGIQARLMSQAMRKLAPALDHSKTVLIFTNQIREKIGIMFGNPETTPGGRALKFYASVRLEIRRGAPQKDSAGKVVGSHTRVKIVKNKVAPPFTEAEFDIYFNEGISVAGSVLDTAVDLGIVTKRGAYLYYGEMTIGQGRDAAVAQLKADPKLLETLRNAALAKHAEKTAPAKPAEKPAAAAPAAAAKPAAK